MIFWFYPCRIHVRRLLRSVDILYTVVFYDSERQVAFTVVSTQIRSVSSWVAIAVSYWRGRYLCLPAPATISVSQPGFLVLVDRKQSDHPMCEGGAPVSQHFTIYPSGHDARLMQVRLHHKGLFLGIR